MKIKDKRVLALYLMVICLVILGVTYALQLVNVQLDVDTAIVKIDDNVTWPSTFDATNLDFRPILDSEVETSTDNVIKTEFVVGADDQNTATDKVIYDIALVDLEVNCALLSPYIKWRLIKNEGQDTEEVFEGSLDYKTFDTIVDGRLVLTSIQQDLPAYSADQSGYDEYTFYMWFSDSCQDDLATCIANGDIEEQSNMLGKNLSGKIEVELYTSVKQAVERNTSQTLDTSVCNNSD